MDQATEFPIEFVATSPSPGLNVPVSLSFSPDSKYLSYLHSNTNELTRQLYGYDIISKTTKLLVEPFNEGDTEKNLSLEEKLRRERQRQHGVGITSYFWNPSSTTSNVLVPLQGDLYLQEHLGQQTRKCIFQKHSTGLAGGAIDPQWSPDGKWIGFVQEGEIYIVSSDYNLASQHGALQITSGARENKKTNGLACFLTQEELARYRGFWWSPDSLSIAFEEIDDNHIPEFRIMHYGKSEVGPMSQEDHRYPFAGKANPKRRLGVVQIRTEVEMPLNPPVWMEFHDQDFYISRVNWLPDGHLGVQKLNRLQTELSLIRFDPLNGKGITLIKETSAIWINSHYLFRCLDSMDSESFRFLWGSERTGFMHIYLYSYHVKEDHANLIGPLTSGDWIVESIDGVVNCNHQNGILFVSGNYESLLERNLFAIPFAFDGHPSIAEPQRLTKGKGTHMVVLDPLAKYFVDVYSNVENASSVTLYSIAPFFTEEIISKGFVTDSQLICGKQSLPPLLENNLFIPPEIISFPTRDGTTTLYAALYLPDRQLYGSGPYPTLVCVYGGPHVQRVANNWQLTVDMRAQRFRSLGYAVLKIDNRGSFRRGLNFEGAIKNRMGTIEVDDQVDGVTWCINKGIVDEKRVGIYGWSYGGYLSAISLMKANQVFKLAIAGAPVTSWDGYDSCYTERYMSTPELNPQGYKEGNVMEFVHQLEPSQKLLLIHGLIDENVHFRHTARLINALIQARKSYDILFFPDERHSPRSLQDRIYMEERIADYIKMHL